MKITIEKRTNKEGDKQSIRLIYWYGSHAGENGKTKHHRKREQLDQYLYTNNAAYDKGIIERNPLKEVTGIKAVTSERCYLTIEEVVPILKATLFIISSWLMLSK